MKNKMTFWEHIDELRSRIIYSLISLVVVTIVAYFFSDKIFNFINQPIYDLKNSNFKQIFSTLTGPFLIYLSISIFTGLFFSFPIITYNILRFIYPAIKRKNIMIIFYVLICCMALFSIGAYFAYSLLVPISLNFLISFNNNFNGIEQLISINDYTSFVVIIVFSTGLLFQLPILAFFLSKLNLISSELLSGKRRYAVLFSFILAAFITPPDIISQLILAIPIILLYEVCIIITRLSK